MGVLMLVPNPQRRSDFPGRLWRGRVDRRDRGQSEVRQVSLCVQQNRYGLHRGRGSACSSPAQHGLLDSPQSQRGYGSRVDLGVHGAASNLHEAQSRAAVLRRARRSQQVSKRTHCGGRRRADLAGLTGEVQLCAGVGNQHEVQSAALWAGACQEKHDKNYSQQCQAVYDKYKKKKKSGKSS